jgi:hypothetical protein
MLDHLGASYAAALIAVLVLALASVTGFGAHLQGTWHVIYVVAAGVALYLNVLVGVLGAVSHTAPSLLLAQVAVVVPFAGVSVVVIKRFRRVPLTQGPGEAEVALISRTTLKAHPVFDKAK